MVYQAFVSEEMDRMLVEKDYPPHLWGNELRGHAAGDSLVSYELRRFLIDAADWDAMCRLGRLDYPYFQWSAVRPFVQEAG